MADRWYRAGYSSVSPGKVLKLHIYTVDSSIDENWTKERADLWLEVTNTTGSYWNNYGSAVYIGINGNDTTQSVKFDARSNGDKLLIGTHDTLVYHDTVGNATIGISAHHHSGNALGNANISDSYKCDNIPRASVPTLNFSEISTGQAVTLFSNRKSSSFTHTIYLVYGGVNKEVATGVTNHWVFDSNVFASELLGQIPNSNRGVGQLILLTYQNETKIGNNHSVGFAYNVANSNPIFENYDVFDHNREISNLTGSSNIFVKGHSTAYVQIALDNKAVAVNRASMSRYRAECGSKSLETAYFDNGGVAIELFNVDSDTVNVYAIDSRNNSTLVQKKVAGFVEYTDVKITKLSLERSERGVGTQVTLKAEGQFWNKNFGVVQNTIKQIRYEYKKNGAREWMLGSTTLNATATDNTFKIEQNIKGDLEANGFNMSDNFQIRLFVADELSCFEDEEILQSGKPTMAIGTGVAFRCSLRRRIGWSSTK